MTEDIELKRLQLKRMMSLAAKLSGQERKKQPADQQALTSLDIVRSHLSARGDEVLDAALSQYPTETKIIMEKLAELIKSGRIKEPIDGGTLYNLFRELGLRVKIDTKIQYVKRGEVKDLKELFK